MKRGIDRRSFAWSIDPELPPAAPLKGWSAQHYPVFPEGMGAARSAPRPLQPVVAPAAGARPAAPATPVVREAKPAADEREEPVEDQDGRVAENGRRMAAAGAAGAPPEPPTPPSDARSFAPATRPAAPADLDAPAPLAREARDFFGPRFGHDFSDVRVHTGAHAARSASALSARAYTVGRDIAFAAGQYAPSTTPGRWLLAHELAHVVQQRGQPPTAQAQLEVSTPGDAGEREADAAAAAVMSGRAPALLGAQPARVQRACNQALGTPSPDCASNDDPVIGERFGFVVACDDLRPGEAAKVDTFAKGLKAGTELRVHGYASKDGPPDFNLDLSCHRANKIADMLRTARADCPVSAVLKHGPQVRPEPEDFWRCVIVEKKATEPKPEPTKPKMCGPDISDWFVKQVAKAKTNKKVLDIKSELDEAANLVGVQADEVMQGAVLEKVLAAEKAAKNPPRSPEATAQIGAASTSTLTGFEIAAVSGNTTAIEVLARLRRAALKWKDLVGHGMPFDFKADPKTLGDPKSDNCPVDCPQTLTFCPTPSGPSSCFQIDMPGNIFYGHIGRFIGFGENVLQLGSQFAQLTSPGGASWDPPEDTKLIHTGFMLPDPLAKSDLCATIQGAKAGFVPQPCADCDDPILADIKDPK